MKIRHQGALLVGIPIVCQLVSAIVLVGSLQSLETAGHKEAKAKAVISACQDVRAAGTKIMLYVAGQQFFYGDEDGTSAKQAMDRLVAKKMRIIETEVADDPEAVKLAHKFRADVNELTVAIGDIGQIMENPEVPHWANRKSLLLARYLNEHEHMEEVSLLFQRCIKDEELIIARFKPMLEEWQPKATQQRRNLVWTAVGGAIAGSILSIAIALVFGKRLVNRLAILMEHIDRFGAGKPVVATVGGNDELTLLDGKFREMAVARYEAEEFKRNLMSMVAHDLRSPLASANLTIDVIIQTRGQQLDEWVKKRLTRLDGELQRLMRLANSLLDIEKIESNKLDLNVSSAKVSQIIEDTIRAVEGSAASKQISIVQNIEGVSALDCDKERIIQVLVNLVSNALKFSPRGSSIFLNVRPEAPNAVRFEVVDQGPGVPEQERSRLFKKFEQLDQEQETKKQGSGFGLYLTSMIVQSHRGYAGYEKPPEGSNFYFVLPATQESDQQAPPESL